MKVISWNIAGWTRRSSKQAESLNTRNSDIVGLQEVTDGSWSVLKEGLISSGLIYNAYSREIVSNCRKDKAVAVFSRWPLTILNRFIDVPYPELTLSMLIHAPYGDIQFHCVHIPNGSSHGWEKIDSNGAPSGRRYSWTAGKVRTSIRRPSSVRSAAVTRPPIFMLVTLTRVWTGPPGTLLGKR